MSFAKGDHVWVRVAPRKGQLRFGVRGKLAPRFIGPFDIIGRVGEVAYRLALPPQLANVHNVFHVSQLRKYVADPSHVINWQDVEVSRNLTLAERPMCILDRQQRQLRGRVVRLVKVQWEHHSPEEATWEQEGTFRELYPDLFTPEELEDEFPGNF